MLPTHLVFEILSGHAQVAITYGSRLIFTEPFICASHGSKYLNPVSLPSEIGNVAVLILLMGNVGTGGEAHCSRR